MPPDVRPVPDRIARGALVVRFAAKRQEATVRGPNGTPPRSDPLKAPRLRVQDEDDLLGAQPALAGYRSAVRQADLLLQADLPERQRPTVVCDGKAVAAPEEGEGPHGPHGRRAKRAQGEAVVGGPEPHGPGGA